MAYEILGKTIYELQDFLSEGGFPKYRAKQLMDYIYKRHITNIDEMVQLPKSLRDWLIKKSQYNHADYFIKTRSSGWKNNQAID